MPCLQHGNLTSFIATEDNLWLINHMPVICKLNFRGSVLILRQLFGQVFWTKKSSNNNMLVYLSGLR